MLVHNLNTSLRYAAGASPWSAKYSSRVRVSARLRSDVINAW